MSGEAHVMFLKSMGPVESVQLINCVVVQRDDLGSLPLGGGTRDVLTGAAHSLHALRHAVGRAVPKRVFVTK